MYLLIDFLKIQTKEQDLSFQNIMMLLSTSLRDILQEYLRSGPSRLKWTWGLSLMMNTMSAGILLGAWSPSRWNVILVPDFQPGFTFIVSTWRIIKIIPDQCGLCYHTFSSFLAVPSPATTLREIFIRLVTPWKCKVVNKKWDCKGLFTSFIDHHFFIFSLTLISLP